MLAAHLAEAQVHGKRFALELAAVPATSKAALAARPSSTSAASAPASAFAASRTRGDQLQASSGHPSNKGGTGSGSSSWPGSNGDRRQSIDRRQKSRGARSSGEANAHVCIGSTMSGELGPLYAHRLSKRQKTFQRLCLLSKRQGKASSPRGKNTLQRLCLLSKRQDKASSVRGTQT